MDVTDMRTTLTEDIAGVETLRIALQEAYEKGVDGWAQTEIPDAGDLWDDLLAVIGAKHAK